MMMWTRRALSRLLAVAATVALSAGLAACGDDSDSGSRASSTQTASNGDLFNDADVDFATNMIPHHAQAVQMANLTQDRDVDAAVRQLAEQIRDAQVPEVETMTDWLTAWDKEVPETSIDHVHGGHDVSEMPDMGGTGDVPGMMSAEEMQELMDAPDAEFQHMWLAMMKTHHEGAIEMAKSEQTDGQFPDAVRLAKSIISTQQAEIEQIDLLLAS